MQFKKIFFWAILYKVLLEVIYVKVISPVYSYSGLTWNPSNLGCFVSYLLFFLLLLLMPKGKDKPSYHLTQLLFFTTAVPLLSFYWLTSQEANYVVMASTCFLILFLIIRFIKPIQIPLLETKTKMKEIRIVDFILCLTLFFLLIFTLKFGGIDLRAFNFSTVYEVRSELVYAGLWGYIINWLSKLFIPFCIVIYLINKQRKLFLFSCFLQVYMYLSTGSKTVLFSVVLLVVSTILLKKGKWENGIPIFYSIVIITSSVVYFITNYLMAIGIFPTRQLIIPAQISFAHYEFFSENPKLFLSETIIGNLFSIDTPYNIHSTFVISNNTNINWNTGFLADSFDNGGFLMMILYTLLLAVILLFLDSISAKSRDRYKYTALSTYSIIILNDGSLLTTLLTWGLGLLLVFIYILSSQENSQNKRFKVWT